MTYLHFTFDGISSKDYNLIIQNKGEDLIFPSQPPFENQLVSPLYQGTSYLAGVYQKPRVFTFNCWVDSISLKQTRELINWLKVDKIGHLLLDYNPFFKYEVKVNSIGDFKHFAVNPDETNNYEFSLSFITLEDYAAQSIDSYSDITGNNPDGFSRGYTSGAYDTYFYNTYNLPFYITFNINDSVGTFTIKKNDVKYYEYTATGDYIINSRTGYCLDSTGKLIEESLADSATFTNLGALEVDSNVKSIYAGVNETGELIFDTTIFLDSTVRVYPSNSSRFYTVDNFNNIINDLGLVIGDVIVLNYLKPTKITLSAGITYDFRYRDNF